MRRDGQPSRDLWVCHLDLIPYPDGVALQETLRERRLAGAIPDTLLLLEHPPTYTRGRRSGADDFPLPESLYRAKGIELHATDRGGKLTYHGPGQLVGYPIVAVGDVGRYLRAIEDAIGDALAEEGIPARSRHAEGIDYTGVWVEDRKIASIGVHVSRGVATHGFAVNVDNDLEPFSWVVACGLAGVRMTSIAAELRSGPRHADYDSAARGPGAAAAGAPGVPCFRKRMAHSFARAFSFRQRLVSPWRLGIGAASASGPARQAAVAADRSAAVVADRAAAVAPDADLQAVGA